MHAARAVWLVTNLDRHIIAVANEFGGGHGLDQSHPLVLAHQAPARHPRGDLACPGENDGARELEAKRRELRIAPLLPGGELTRIRRDALALDEPRRILGRRSDVVNGGAPKRAD